MSLSRRLLLQLAGAHVVAPALRMSGRGVLSILMLHRFTDPDTGVVGTDPATLRDHLAYLRRHRYRLAGLADVPALLAAGDDTATAPTVVFTVDDGYADFAHIAAPIFAEFDCPVTLFVTTGFLDGHLWLWWDRVAHLFAQTRRVALPRLGSRGGPYEWTTPGERDRVQREVIQDLEWLDAPERDAAIAELAHRLDVELPASPPPAYAPLTWDEVRRTARFGATFGPHTVTHRILSQAPDDACGWEIEESYRQLDEQTDACIPAFCYPHGGGRSFGQREVDAVRRAGLEMAVTAVPGYPAVRRVSDGGSLQRFTLPRFPYPDDRPHLVHVVAGLARVTGKRQPSPAGA